MVWFDLEIKAACACQLSCSTLSWVSTEIGDHYWSTHSWTAETSNSSISSVLLLGLMSLKYWTFNRLRPVVLSSVGYVHVVQIFVLK